MVPHVRFVLLVVYVFLLFPCLSAHGADMAATAWKSAGTGDCPGSDVAGSTGPNPVADKCTSQFAGFTAVCWKNNCTYKNVPTGKCTGGSSPGRMYTCSPSASASSAPPAVGKSSSTSLPGSAQLLGCYKDQDNRDLNGSNIDDPKMTTEMCVSACAQKGFAYAGTQFARQCFCGNSYGKYGKANNCDAKCVGNPNQICGGTWANSVYQVGGSKPQPPTTPSTSSKGTAKIDSFSWQGKDSDKVGEWGNGKPDGKMDGHFRLQLNLPQQTEITSIAVYSADNSGNPSGGQLWHTQNTGNWMAGVFYQGRQVNSSHVQTLGKFSGNIEFDVYCNDSGWFNNGQNFLVEVTPANGPKLTKTVKVTLDGQQQQTSSTQSKPSTGGTAKIDSFSWQGKDSDKVGEWGNGKPDGKMDGHFRLQLNLPQQTEITSIAVYSADNSGNPSGGQLWHTQNTANWMAGVFYQGRQVNSSHVQTLGKFTGSIDLDVYCNDSGWFNNGQNFLVEVTLAGGTKLTKTVKVTLDGQQQQTSSTQSKPLIGSAQALGCFRDQDNRDLNGANIDDPKMTTEMCVSACAPKGFAYAGTQFARQCFCGNSYGKYGKANNCDAKCVGNPNQICGGTWANSVYQVGGSKPKPSTKVGGSAGLTTIAPPDDPVITSNFNTAAVQSGPPQRMLLTLKSPYRITWIQNYHYFNNGEPAGTITLKHKDGTMYGPWQAEGADLGGNVPNAYWVVRPNIEVKPGNYNIIDSSPSTWSYNAQSNNWGMTEIRGVKVSTQAAPQQGMPEKTVAVAPKSGEKARDGRFIAYNNDTVLDTRTGLMWAAKDNGASINWANAKSYCSNYRGGGYTDWRMPTQDELVGLFDGTLTDKKNYHKTLLIELTGCCAWASETRGSAGADLNFWYNEAKRDWTVQAHDYDYRVIPVRSGK